MCGILGGWGQFEALGVEAALDLMVHRGPDSQGVWFEGTMFLGMRRLSIIDLEGGDQPIANENGRCVIVCNGEIYNYRELTAELQGKDHVFQTRSDVECVIHAYEDDRDGFPRSLRGMFGAAIADLDRKMITLCRDRYGKKPLYYTLSQNGDFLFASELRALKALMQSSGSWTGELDEEAISDYLSLGSVPQPKTIYKGVFSVPPGSCLRYDGTTLEIKQYWNMVEIPEFSGNYADAKDLLRDLMGECVNIRLRSDVPVGVFLSGGVDSSIVAYEASRRYGSQLESFTVGSDDPTLNESAVARRTAKALGIKNNVLDVDLDPLELIWKVVGHYGQPFSDASALPSLAVSAAAARRVKVVLNGDGGDEQFGGYRRYIAARAWDRLKNVPRPCWKVLERLLISTDAGRRSRMGLLNRYVRGATMSWGQRYLAWTTDMLMESEKEAYSSLSRSQSTEEWVEKMAPEQEDGLRSLIRADRRVNLQSGLLVKMDMASMAYSLEARSPFMDHILGEFADSLPASMLVRRTMPKAILRDAYRGILSEEVLNGKKRGFEIPLVHWLRGPLRELVFDSVGGSNSRVSAFLDRSFVREIIEQKRCMDRNWGYIVYSLLILELWLRNEER